MKALRRILSAWRQTDDATRTQWAYIAEAALEYFVSITTTGAFLTILIKQLGVSDALTGIISTLTTLACGLQVFSVGVVRGRSVRLSVLVCQTLQQLIYAFLFLLPFIPMAHGVRVGLFVVLFLAAGALANLVSPAKFNWMMSFVHPTNRGIFTSHKEMISLATGLVYNYGMSRVVDYYAAIGQPKTGLRLCAVAIAVVMVLHSASVFIARERRAGAAPVQSAPKTSLFADWRSVLSLPAYRKLLVAVTGWNFFLYLAYPYHSIYILQELGGSATVIAVGGIIGSVARFAVSPAVGKYGDKKGFAHSVTLGLLCAAVSYLMLIFWQPSNGVPVYMVFQFPYAIAMATISGGMININFQYVPAKDRITALGVSAALGGVGGFVGSVVGGAILGAVQAAGNQVLGISMYGQQFLNAITFTGLVALTLYEKFVIQRLRRTE